MTALNRDKSLGEAFTKLYGLGAVGAIAGFLWLLLTHSQGLRVLPQ